MYSLTVAASDPNMVLAGGNAGIFRSTDSGRSWVTAWSSQQSLLARDKIYSLASTPLDPDLFFAGHTGNGVLRSDDGGVSWVQSSQGITNTKIHEVVIAPSNPQIVYAGSHGGVFRSDDGGLTWQPRNDGLGFLNVTTMDVHPSNPDIVYASTGVQLNTNHTEHFVSGFQSGDGLYKTTNGGRSWTRTDDGLEEYGIVTLMGDPNLPFRFWLGGAAARGAFMSPDGGDTFSFVPSLASHYSMIIVSGRRPPYPLYETSTQIFGELMKSEDLGRTWKLQKTQFLRGISQETRDAGLYVESGLTFIHLHGLAIDPNDDDNLYVGNVHDANQPVDFNLTGAHIFRSTDGGATWTRTDDGLEEYGIVTLMGDPNLPFRFWLGGAAARGAFMSPDGGDTFSFVPSLASHYSMIIVSGRRPPYPLYETSTQIFGELMKSEDLGRTWKLQKTQFLRGISQETRDAGLYVESGLTFIHLHGLAIDPNDDDNLYVGNVHDANQPVDFNLTGAHIFRSTDGGATWTRTDDGLEEYGIVTLMGDPNLPFRFWLGGAAARGAFMSPDGGDTFSFVPSLASHYSMIIVSGRRPPYPLYETSTQIFGELMKSEDLGRTWKLQKTQFLRGISQETRDAGLYVESGLTFIHLHGLAIDPNDDDNLYVGNVHDANQPVDFNLTGAHIFRSTDGGATWTESSEGFPIATQTSIGFILVDPTDSNVVYVATTVHESTTAIGVYRSDDAGDTWSPATTGLSSLDIRHLAADPVNSGTVYAATGSGVYKSSNRGNRWQQANSEITTTEVFTLAMSPANPNILYAATANGVFKTKNGGNDWYAVNLGLPIGGRVPVMGHHVVLAFDATGSVLFAVVQVGDNEFDGQRLVYRAVQEPLAQVVYTYAVDVDNQQVLVGVESTSAIYDVSFDSGEGKLDFNASGPSGTIGRAAVQVPRSLIKGPFTVTVDGSTVSFESQISEGGDSTISFSYSHSVRAVAISGS